MGDRKPGLLRRQDGKDALAVQPEDEAQIHVVVHGRTAQEEIAPAKSQLDGRVRQREEVKTLHEKESCKINDLVVNFIVAFVAMQMFLAFQQKKIMVLI